MRRLIIIGASGHGKVVADIARLNGYTDRAFLDDNPCLQEVMGIPVLGSTASFPIDADADYFVAIGNSKIRRTLQEKISSADGRVISLVHPSAVVADSSTLGQGTVVMAGAVINPCVRIGEGCIINTAASVDHDCVVGDYSHISVGAHLAGAVEVGSECWFGIGAVVSNNLSICNGCIIGAGAVVVRNLINPGTYVGIPARMLGAVHES